MVMVSIDFESEEEFEQVKDKAKKLKTEAKEVIDDLKRLFFLD